MKSFLVYKFTCASCSSSYIGETCRHFKTCTEQRIKKDSKSHIFKHLHSTATCFDIFFVFVFFCFLFCVFLFLRFSFIYFFIISDINYWYISQSYLHFAITSSNHNTPCITSFSFIHCFYYLYGDYWHLCWLQYYYYYLIP